MTEFNQDALEDIYRSLAVKLGLSTRQLFGVLRMAITGRIASPPLFETMAVLGKGRCLKRIRKAITKLKLD